MSGPIFIIGSPRSGKTLLSATLNKHPEILIFPELNSFSSVFRLWTRQYEKSNTKTVSCLARTLFDNWKEINRRYSISIEDISECIASEYHSFGVSLSRYMSLLMCKAKPSAKIWGDDTPHNTGYIKSILGEYPNAYFIYSQRDPRSVISDLSSNDYKDATNNALQNAFIVKQYVKQYKKHQQLIPQSQLLNVKHEDFLENPEETTKHICGFLHVEYSPHLIEPAGQEVIQLIGWPEGRFWGEIQVQEQKRVSCEVEAYVAELINELGYTKNGACNLNCSHKIAHLKLLPYLSLFILYSAFWKIKYPAHPFLVSKLPYLQ